MKTSKVVTIAVSGNSSWNGKELTKHFVLFENGETGTLTTGFQEGEVVPIIGAELSYEIVDKGFGPEVKLERKSTSTGFKSKAWSPEQVSQQDAIKITSAALDGGKLELADYKLFFIECKNFMLEQIKKDNDTLPF